MNPGMSISRTPELSENYPFPDKISGSGKTTDMSFEKTLNNAIRDTEKPLKQEAAEQKASSKKPESENVESKNLQPIVN